MILSLEKKIEIATGLLEQTVDQLKKSDQPSEAYIFLRELLSNFIALNSSNYPKKKGKKSFILKPKPLITEVKEPLEQVQPKVEEIKEEFKEEYIPPLPPIRKKESLITKFKNLFKGKKHDPNLTECDQKEQQDSKES